ncbi:MAG: hypothetical protein KDA65_12305, partial [Planctomycetaceae bacterium]|nr:hypothetical protein [Planctomycetaceae bacterium]
FHSMDQFRGFIIFAMYLVHCHLWHLRVFENHDYHAQFGDMIMPGFIFAVGFSFRLSIQRRKQAMNHFWLTASYLRRSLILILIVLLMEGFGSLGTWDGMNNLPRTYVGEATVEEGATDVGEQNILARLNALQGSNNNADGVEVDAETDEDEAWFPNHFCMHWWHWILGIFHRQICEVLGIIAVTQFVILPLILTSARVRIIAMFLFALAHPFISAWFGWNYQWGQPNVVDDFLNFTPMRGWDGGLFGNISWAAVMLAGSLSYDFVNKFNISWKSAGQMAALGAILMVVGYLGSIPSTMYNLNGENQAELANQEREFAEHPFVPPSEAVSEHSFTDWFPPLPILQSDEEWQVARNYWMMSKRIVSLPYVLFSIGFCFALFAFFIAMSDILGVKIGVFRTLGTNALIAYAVHFLVLRYVAGLFPQGAPDWFKFVQFGFFFAIMYLILFSLERRKLFIRL